MATETATTSPATATKAWIYTTPGYPETLKLSTHPSLPQTPAPHHLLIKIHAAALNPVDIQLMNLPLFALPGLRGPKITGCDFAGTVLAAGTDTSFAPGDDIMGFSGGKPTSGFLAETVHLDERHATIVRKPKMWSSVQAAALPLVWLTARTCIERVLPYLKDSKDPKLTVLGGSSATGMYVTYLAAQRGWKVQASCSSRNLDFVASMGASTTVDYTASPTAVVDAVKSFSPNAIVDCVGGTDCIGLAQYYVTIVGDKTSRATMGGSALYLTSPRMLARWALGALGIGWGYDCIVLEGKKEYLEEAFELPKEKIVVDGVFGFEEVREAFERLNTGRSKGKVVVKIDE